MSGLMPHEVKPGFVNVYRNTFNDRQTVGGLVHGTRDAASLQAKCFLSRKCVYRIRIVEVHDEPMWRRYGAPNPEAYAARVAFLKLRPEYGAKHGY